MATLNVKNFPERLHRKLRERAKQQHRSVAQEIVHLLSEAVEQPPPRSILELRGLGKEGWAGVDPAEHVRRERDAWG
jgi:plasmid stability protein